MIPSLHFTGQSGEQYLFHVFSLVQERPTVPAVYIVTCLQVDVAHKHLHDVIYIGETDDLAQAFDSHPLMHQFLGEYHVNTICYIQESDLQARKELLTDLKASLDPVIHAE